jgi:protein-tyrosine phosphatase
MSEPLRVLMVCTGNICRSPTAEGMLRHLANAAGVGHRLVVDSAGTTGHHVGEPPDLRAQRHALRRGVDLSTQRARQVISSDFEHFDHVLAMDRSHLQALKRQAGPGAAGRIRLLMDFAGGAPGRDVPDPYYGGGGRLRTGAGPGGARLPWPAAATVSRAGCAGLSPA